VSAAKLTRAETVERLRAKIAAMRAANAVPTTPAPRSSNRAYFSIRYVGMDMWMEDCGNLSSQLNAAIFDTVEDAQRFLDTRRLRRGFRPNLKVQEVAVERIAEMAEEAQRYSEGPKLPFGNHEAEWAARAEVLRTYLPLEMAA